MRIPPAVLLSAAASAQILVTRDGRPPGPVGMAAGGVVALASAGLIAASIARFRHEETSIDPVTVDKASSLVTEGPNALTRNPMYVGMAGLLAAHALIRGSWRAALPVAGYVLAIDRWQIRAEEEALSERFGTAYDVYRENVPRWLGLPAGGGAGSS